MLQLAASVWARRPGAALNKAGAPLVAGLWLGRDSVTDEHVIATGAGVFRTRTVKRKPAEAEWDSDAILGMVWEPWNTGKEIRGRPPKQHSAREPILAAPLPSSADDHAFKKRAGGGYRRAWRRRRRHQWQQPRQQQRRRMRIPELPLQGRRVMLQGRRVLQ